MESSVVLVFHDYWSDLLHVTSLGRKERLMSGSGGVQSRWPAVSNGLKTWEIKHPPGFDCYHKVLCSIIIHSPNSFSDFPITVPLDSNQTIRLVTPLGRTEDGVVERYLSFISCRLVAHLGALVFHGSTFPCFTTLILKSSFPRLS